MSEVSSNFSWSWTPNTPTKLVASVETSTAIQSPASSSPTVSPQAMTQGPRRTNLSVSQTMYPHVNKCFLSHTHCLLLTQVHMNT